MEVVWSLEAREQLSAIYTRLETQSVASAVAALERLFGSADRLAQFPELGRMLPGERFRRLRELVVGDYRLLYFIEPDHIAIIGVFHGSSPWD